MGFMTVAMLIQLWITWELAMKLPNRSHSVIRAALIQGIFFSS